MRGRRRRRRRRRSDIRMASAIACRPGPLDLAASWCRTPSRRDPRAPRPSADQASEIFRGGGGWAQARPPSGVVEPRPPCQRRRQPATTCSKEPPPPRGADLSPLLPSSRLSSDTLEQGSARRTCALEGSGEKLAGCGADQDAFLQVPGGGRHPAGAPRTRHRAAKKADRASLVRLTVCELPASGRPRTSPAGHTATSPPPPAA